MPITLNKVIVVSGALSADDDLHLTQWVCVQNGAPEIPYAEACKPAEGEAPDDTPYCLGIDEAGRGAMLGHMTYGIAWCPVDKKEELATMGFMGARARNECQINLCFSMPCGSTSRRCVR